MNNFLTRLHQLFAVLALAFIFPLSSANAAEQSGAMYSLSQISAATQSPLTRSIRNWVRCDGRDDDSGVIAAFGAAKDGGFTLIVDCPVFIHVGMDIRRPIYIDNGTTIQFTENGLFKIDNVLIPAFVIANSAKVRLLGWRVQYVAGLPVDNNIGGYYDNGVFVQQKGYDQPAAAFNDRALTPWLTLHRGIHFTQANSPWAGPSNTSAVFFIIGSTKDVDARNLRMFVAPQAKGSQFIPVAFSSTPGYNNNESVTRQTPITSESLSVASDVTFSDIDLDGYYMGWQGHFQNATFEHIRAHRYGDLEDAQGGTVGGVGKWFAPPHLFYLNCDPKQIGLENRNVRIVDVIDFGNRVGVARDRGGADKGSGYANSLKIGARDSAVDGYKSYRPDGLLDLLASNNLKISNVEATYDSSFLNDMYQGIRFPGPPYQHVTLENISLVDKSAVTKMEPIGGSYDPSNTQIVMMNVRVNLNNWAKASANLNAAIVNSKKASINPKPSPATLCPHLAGSGHSLDIQFTITGTIQKCRQPQ